MSDLVLTPWPMTVARQGVRGGLKISERGSPDSHTSTLNLQNGSWGILPGGSPPPNAEN